MSFTEQQEIESLGFEIRTNIASGLNVLLSAIASEAAVIELQAKLQQDSTLINDLLKAMRRLRDCDYDKQYRNPKDTAMATYGWLIISAKPELMGLVADLLRALPNAWWSLYLARRYQTRIQKNRVSMLPQKYITEATEAGHDVVHWHATTRYQAHRDSTANPHIGSKVKPRYLDSMIDTLVQEFQSNLAGNPALDEFNIYISEGTTSDNVPTIIYEFSDTSETVSAPPSAIL